jgi:hypothetical protein
MNNIDTPSTEKLPRGLLLVPLLGALTVIAILTAMVVTIIGGPELEPKFNLGISPTTDWTAAISAEQRASEVVTNANAVTEHVNLAVEALNK